MGYTRNMVATPSAVNIMKRPADDLFTVCLSGRAYIASTTGSLASSATTNIQLKTAAGVTPVLIVTDFGGDGETLKITITENPTVTDGTTAVTPRNMDRNSTNTATTVVYTDPTSISGGTVLIHELTDAGHKVAGASSHEIPMTLKSNEDYVFTLQNIGANTATYVWKLIWAE